MAALSEYRPAQTVKMILFGHPGSGKTGALASLVKAGYKLRILDFDGLLHSLIHFVKKTCPEKEGNVDVISLNDRWENNGVGLGIKGVPTAFTRTTKVLNDWPGLGKPESWGPSSILVIDSLTQLSNAATNWAASYHGSPDGRKQTYEAQKAVNHLMQLLKSDDFNTNVIVTCHPRLQQLDDGTQKMLPIAPGDKLSPQIPAYFSTIASMQTSGAADAKRSISVKATVMLDLRTPKALDKTYPIETGLADLFLDLRGPAPSDSQ